MDQPLRYARKKVIVTLLVLLLLPFTMAGANAESSDGEIYATGSPGSVPSPAALSAAVASACGDLLAWHLDELGDEIGLAWRLDFARCALTATHGHGFFEGIGYQCRALAYHDQAPCAKAVLTDSGLGPQFVALAEACSLIALIDEGACSYLDLLEFLGLEQLDVPASGGDGDDCVLGMDYQVFLPNPCDLVKGELCELGICLDAYIFVDHVRTDFDEVQGGCPGIQVEGTATVSSGGSIFTIPGFYVRWKTKTTAVVTVSVSWQVTCETDAYIEGIAEGGFMRQLRISRQNEGGPVCEYDGLIRVNCGDEPGEQWVEHVVEASDGTYDYQNGDGDKPPAVKTVESLPGGKWYNEFQGSLKVIQLTDEEADVLYGSRDFVVEYESNGGDLDQVEQVAVKIDASLNSLV